LRPGPAIALELLTFVLLDNRTSFMLLAKRYTDPENDDELIWKFPQESPLTADVFPGRMF
jgi:hypothetical protein